MPLELQLDLKMLNIQILKLHHYHNSISFRIMGLMNDSLVILKCHNFKRVARVLMNLEKNSDHPC